MGNKFKDKPASEKVADPGSQKSSTDLFTETFGKLSATAQRAVLDRIKLDAKATKAANKQYLENTIKGAQKVSAATLANEQTMAPQYANLHMGILDQTDPEFRAVRNKLGKQVSGDLDNGYALGEGLSREIEQDLRGAQDARGNWLGPAATADEAFKKASARLALYQQRQQAAGAFLAGTSAADKMGSIRGSTAATQNYAPIQAQSGYDPTGAAMGLTGMQFQNEQNAFLNRLAATQQRNQATASDYDYRLQNFLLNKYQLPAMSAGGGGAGGTNWGGAATGAATGALTGPRVAR